MPTYNLPRLGVVRVGGRGLYLSLQSKSKYQYNQEMGTNICGMHALCIELAALHIFSHLIFPTSLQIIINPALDVEREAHRG